MSVWPLPASFERGNQVVWLSANVSFSYERLAPDEDEDGSGTTSADAATLTDLFAALSPSSGRLGHLHGPASKHDFLHEAFGLFRKVAVEQAFIPWKMHPRGTAFEPALDSSSHHSISKIIFLEHDQRTTSRFSPEAYRLEIRGDGSCEVHVTHVLGAIAALSTISQLFYGHSKTSGTSYCANAPLIIQDQPVFSHRGLNLDICRNVIPPDAVRRTLVGLWLSKMNKLHLHATDSQSWPLEIPALPQLAARGAYHESQIWSVKNLEEIQDYGRSLGIEVYIEIDMPGHTGSVWHAYPDLVVAYEKPWQKYALEPPAGQLKLASPAVDEFLGVLLNDLGPRVAPYTGLFHVGGDELNTESYKLEPDIGSSDKTVLRPYLQRLFHGVFKSLTKNNLRPVLWEDILLDYEGLRFPTNTLFQVWRSHDSLARVLDAGYEAIVGPADYWYLDVGLGGFMDPDPNNPDSPVKPPYPDWNPPYKNWRLVYSYDPFKGLEDDDDDGNDDDDDDYNDNDNENNNTQANVDGDEGTSEKSTTTRIASQCRRRRDRIRGGEVSCWGELTDAVNLDAMLWPRVAAAAEVLWSGPATARTGAKIKGKSKGKKGHGSTSNETNDAKDTRNTKDKEKQGPSTDSPDHDQQHHHPPVGEERERENGKMLEVAVSEAVTRRLAELRERLVLLGFGAGVVQMEWILRNRGRGNW